MTPAMLSAISSAALPITWRFRATFTAGHVEALLDNLRAGIPLAASLRAALGPTLPRGTFRKRVHDEADAAEALAAACAACPALRAEVDAAEAEGRARLRVEDVGGAAKIPEGDGAPSTIQRAMVGGSGSEAEHEGGEQVHAQQGATAEVHAQEKATCPDCGERVFVDGPGAYALDDGTEPRLREHYRYIDGNRAGMCVGGGKRKDEGPGALRAPEPIRASPVAHHHTLAANGSQPPGTSLAQPTAAPAIAQAPAWREAVARSAALDAEATPRVQPGAPSSRWAAVLAEAQAAHPRASRHVATLLWIDQRRQKAKMHGLDTWHVDTLAAFYDSGKLVLAERIGLRGAKSVTGTTALGNDGLFGETDTDPGTVLVIPIMSADRTEATDRFVTLRKTLGACGVASSKGDDAGDLIAGGLGTEYTASTLPSGGGVIKTVDIQGHAIEYRIYPARINGAIGYTAKAGLCDEVDLWPVDLGVSTEDVAQRSADGKANPADVVLDRLLERFTTTMRTAHLYIVSASYRGHDSAHARKIKEGDTAIQMVARLGVLGAERDVIARRRLAVAIGSTDPRLLANADPLSTDIGAWVSNPAAPIETCYALSRSRLGPMLGRYGGRPDESAGNGPLAEVVPPGAPRVFVPIDVVTGVSPPEDGHLWGLVSIGIDGTGHLRVTEDRSEIMDGQAAAAWLAEMVRPSVLACPRPMASLLFAELSAAYAGGVIPPAPVAPVDIHDGPALRLGPLRTLYQRGRLSHAPGLDVLEAEERGALPEGPRCPRVEALAAAVTRLIACYPHLGGSGRAETVSGPRVGAACMVGGGIVREPDGWTDP